MSAFRSDGERMVWASHFDAGSATPEYWGALAVLRLRGENEAPTQDIINAMLAEMRGEGATERAEARISRDAAAQILANENARLRAALEAVESCVGGRCPSCDWEIVDEDTGERLPHGSDCIVGEALGR